MEEVRSYSRNTGALIFVNLITLSRIPLIIIFMYYLIRYFNIGIPADNLMAIILSCCIIFSDFIDGKLARRYNVTTKTGQVLDIYLDFTYIILGIVILAVYQKIDCYFSLVIIYKFLEFIVMSKLLKGKFKSRKGTDYFYDRLGTLISGVYYVIPVSVMSLSYFYIPYKEVIIKIGVIIITLLTVISSVQKITSSFVKKEETITLRT